MLLGKRPRPPMRRTTSMTGITVDLPDNNNVEGQDPSPSPGHDHHLPHQGSSEYMGLLAMVSPRVSNLQRRNSGDFDETSHFLRTCGLCRRRLAPGRDIYMYRGDTAFCSLECREQQMKQDETKEKKSTMSNGGFVSSSSSSSNNEDRPQHAPSSPSTQA